MKTTENNFSFFPHFLLGCMVELRTSVRRKNFIKCAGENNAGIKEI